MSEEPPPPPTATASAVAKRGRAPASFKGNFGNRREPPGRGAPSSEEEKPKFRAGGGRLFIGNLESEHLTKEEFRDIFSLYGDVIEVSLHKSYGFVQFADEADMYKAMEGEQGRMIGSRNIDIQRAKQDKEKNRPAFPRGRGGRGNQGNKRRRDDFYNDGVRDRGGSRYRRDPEAGGRYNDGYNRQVVPPKNGAVVKIILLGDMQRNFAKRVGNAIGDARVPWEIEMLDGRSLSQTLRDCESNKSRYALIVGRENVNKGTITIKLLHLKEEQGRCPTYDLEIDRLVDLIVSEERKLGFTEAGSRASLGTNSLSLGVQNPVMTPVVGMGAGLGQPAPNASLSAIQQQLSALSQQLTQIAPQNQAPGGMAPAQNGQLHLLQQSQPLLQGGPVATNSNANALQDQIAQMKKLLSTQFQQLQTQTSNTTQQPSWSNNGNLHSNPTSYDVNQPTSGLPNFQPPNLSHATLPSSRPLNAAPSGTARPAASASQLQDLSKLLQTIQKARSAGK